jgi:hypothetical protein
LSQESWFKKGLPWVDYLKLRASFGLTGRDNVGAWAWLQTYAIMPDDGPVFGTNSANDPSSHLTLNAPASGSSSRAGSAAVNRDARWDKAYKGNIGLDFNVLNNRLTFNIDAYYNWNREILMNLNQSIPGYVGTIAARTNLGKIDEYGAELSATWRDRIGKDFKYRIQLNTAYGDNKVLLEDWTTDYLYRQVQKGDRSDLGAWGMQCLGMFRSYQDIEEYFAKNHITTYMGLTKDQVKPGMLIYKDVRGAYLGNNKYAGPDGVVDKDNDQVHLSNRSNPYGVTTNLSADWKGLSLTAQLSASWGGYSFVPSAALKPAAASVSDGYRGLEYANMPAFWNTDNMYVYEDVHDAAGNVVVKANRDAKYPNLRYYSINAAQSSFWRVSGARFRLNRLTVAYAIPPKYLKWTGVESCRFNVTGQNLLSFLNPYPDNFMDPMSTYGAYPTLRKFTIGVNLSF